MEHTHGNYKGKVLNQINFYYDDEENLPWLVCRKNDSGYVLAEVYLGGEEEPKGVGTESITAAAAWLLKTYDYKVIKDIMPISAFITVSTYEQGREFDLCPVCRNNTEMPLMRVRLWSDTFTEKLIAGKIELKDVKPRDFHSEIHTVIGDNLVMYIRQYVDGESMTADKWKKK